MDRNIQISEKLTKVSEREWIVILEKVRTHVKIKLCNKTLSGVHCEANLGMSAEDYYIVEAINKIYQGVWDWKYEQYTLIEQIIRVIDSMISENVRKWKTNEEKRMILQELDVNIDIPDAYNDIDLSDENIAKLEHLIGEDTECYMVLHGLLEKKTFNELCKLIDCEKKKFYKIVERLRKHIKKRDGS